MTMLYTEPTATIRSATSSPSAHSTAAATWTRDFGFGGLQPRTGRRPGPRTSTPAASWASPPTTRLTHLSNDPTASAPTYSYDPNGNLTGITTSRHLDWTHDDRLGCLPHQAGGAAPTMTATYLYDSRRHPRQEGRHPRPDHGVHRLHRRHLRALQPGPARPGPSSRTRCTSWSAPAAWRPYGSERRCLTTPPQPRNTSSVITSVPSRSSSTTPEAGSTGKSISPYGETLLGSYAHKRYRYAGRERDEESGLDYSQARYYAPWLARWISPDPLTVLSLGADLNPYVYAGNRPLATADLSGLDGQSPSASSSAAPESEGGMCSEDAPACMPDSPPSGPVASIDPSLQLSGQTSQAEPSQMSSSAKTPAPQDPIQVAFRNMQEIDDLPSIQHGEPETYNERVTKPDRVAASNAPRLSRWLLRFRLPRPGLVDKSYTDVLLSRNARLGRRRNQRGRDSFC